MKRLLPIIIALAGCQSGTTETPMSPADSVAYLRGKDSFVNAEMARLHKEVNEGVSQKFKAKSEAESPVKITNARLSTDEYGSTDVVVTYKNAGDKPVDGIKVGWILTNNFGDPVDGSHNGGIDQDLLRPGKSTTSRWEIYRTTAKKVSAYIRRVHFTDGTSWEN